MAANRLSNILSPLDTCHGDIKVWAIHETSPVQSARLRIGGPSFRVHPGALVAKSRFWVALLVFLGFIAMSFIDGPYWPRIDDTAGVTR